jgi:hypothetical protein
MKPYRVVLQILGGALAAATMACSGSGSSSLLSTASTEVGATIRGTVDAGASSASESISMQSATGGIRVSVMGANLSAMTDDSGRFTLAGVPAGDARLRFEGQGIDAQLEVSGLRDGQVLTLNVRLSGSRAIVVSGPTPAPAATPSPAPTPSPRPSPTPSPEDEVEFRGRIDSVGDNLLVVAGRTVHVTGSTRIRRRGDPIPFSRLQPGQLVEVEGTPQSDGSVVARKITLEDDGNDDRNGDDGNDDNGDDDNGAHAEFRGAIQSLAPPNLQVAGRRVTTDGGTRILGHRNQAISLGDLKVGQIVEVEGRTQSDGRVLASKIKVED